MPGTSSSGGRNRKSRREHEVAGTYRKDRHGPKSDAPAPDPPKGRPSCPRELAGAARAEWLRMVRRLEASKTLSTVDDAVLYQYCCLFGETEGIRESRLTNARLLAKLETALGRVRHEDQVAEVAGAIATLQKLDAKHVQQLRQGHMGLRQYLVEFGMTPAARTRVKQTGGAPATNEPDLFAEFDAPRGTH
jgi:P27 family predicted phage terminase small subunit